MRQLAGTYALVVAAICMNLPVIVTTQETSSAMDRFRPLTDERLAHAHQEPDNWFVYRRTSDQWAYSPLQQVTPDNVHQLQLAWSAGMRPTAGGPGLLARNQQEPVVLDGVMYVLHGEAEALDARTGESIWKFHDDAAKLQSPARSLAVYRDKVIFPAADTRVVGLNARTGTKLWDVQTFTGLVPTDNAVKGHAWSAGPQVGKGKAFLGTACSTKTIPCYVAAIDVETGKLLWRRTGIAGPDDPEKDQATWGGLPYDRRHKVSFWGTGSFDPKSNTTYWGSASASPYPAILRGSGDGDMRYTNSTLAIDADTGKLKWTFQHLPRDNWDWDHSSGGRIYRDSVRVQPDASLKWFNPATKTGQVRNVIYAMGKPTILWALDRDTGEFLWAKELLPQNVYRSIDGTGKVTLHEDKIPKAMGDSMTICPGYTGGGNWQFMAYSPQTNALIISVFQQCSVYTVDRSIVGYSFTQIPMPGSNGNLGRMFAVDAATGKTLWSYEQRLRMFSVLATAGGLVLVGDEYRHLIALDAKTGKKIWQLGLNGPVMGNPISYAIDGRQYIAVMVGTSATGYATPLNLVPEIQPRYGSIVMMAFALPTQKTTKSR